MQLWEQLINILGGTEANEGHIPKQQQYGGSKGALYRMIPKLLSSNTIHDTNLSSCLHELIPAPCLTLLLSPCSSPLAEQCLLHAVSASAAKRQILYAMGTS